MRNVQSILFEPVGCLAEFPADAFLEIAARLSGRERKQSKSGSRSYWHLLNLIEASGKQLDEAERSMVEALEVEAAESACAYEDVRPALMELKSAGLTLLLVSSLSARAVERFLEQTSFADLFQGVWSRDHAGGIKSVPIERAIAAASLTPAETMYLTDTAEGLQTAKSAGVNAILMMNDPDEARRLAAHEPAGGIVSLHELPDFIRFVAAEKVR
jgi:phosphoglycolate phosphatase-like HAD superfamily hydrolase